jgi:hypothetical protein
MKSRLKKIGVDNSYQFEGAYMSYMVNRIIQSLFLQDSHIERFTEENFVNKERTARIKDLELDIKIKLTPDDFDKILG